MFEASVDGQAYDPDRCSQYYKPSGFQSKGGDENTGGTSTAKSTPAAAPAPAPTSAPFDTDEDDDAPVATAAVTAKPSSQKAEDILAMIRNRAK